MLNQGDIATISHNDRRALSNTTGKLRMTAIHNHNRDTGITAFLDQVISADIIKGTENKSVYNEALT